jgi:hypothetical protein
MENQVDIAKHPYGLGGGIILSGSVQMKVEGFIYYPLATSEVTLKMPNLTNGESFTNTFTAGLPMYGYITEVTQSSGLAVIYSGSMDQHRL